ncbi:hypothetical protein GCWU000282_00328 [Catonella morbi ATCC 51271]|uniref:AAA domain-containing protein n=1 Tax=Catonella morbi ATCC 51271 TaxID=592026 RepID=V2XR25_9FIRM|nr:hypothetical protein [Catonella morbi]ESL04614.1 hypothetical protein GCWU000282_00328 [Catonella morbi ATCC 51271]
MLVTFWSGAEIRTGVTTNTALISHFYAQRYKKKVALFENHVPGKYSLEDILIGKKSLPFLFEEPIFYNRNNNINYYYGLMKAGLPVKGISNAALRMAEGRLHYFPQFSSNHTLFDYEMNKVIDRFIDELNSRYEVVFVDLKRINTMTTKHIIERSDIVFVNVPQDEISINRILDDNLIEREKLCFILSRYKQTSKIDFEEIVADYDIDNERISYIPYYESLIRICKNGNLSNFLIKNFWSTRGEKSFELVSQLRKLTNFIKSQIEEGVEKERAV